MSLLTLVSKVFAQKTSLIQKINGETEVSINRDSDGEYTWAYHCLESEETFSSAEDALLDWIQWATNSLNEAAFEDENEDEEVEGFSIPSHLKLGESFTREVINGTEIWTRIKAYQARNYDGELAGYRMNTPDGERECLEKEFIPDDENMPIRFTNFW